MQRLACDELFSDLTLERGAVRSMLRHGFHPPEARQRWSIPFAQYVHPEGRTPPPGQLRTAIDSTGGALDPRTLTLLLGRQGPRQQIKTALDRRQKMRDAARE